MEILSDIPSIVRVQFTAEDVVRHELVMRIVNAYDEDARRKVCIRRALEEQALKNAENNLAEVSKDQDHSGEAAQ
jgi:phosphate starvation-inducible PhoH-like protein